MASAARWRARARSFGECEVFSFHATKFFNTFEGGAVVTNDDALAEKMRLMRNFGFSGYDNVIYPGTNGKMTEIAAAMGLTNLEDIDAFVAVNRRNYEAIARPLRRSTGSACSLTTSRSATTSSTWCWKSRRIFRFRATGSSTCCMPKTCWPGSISGPAATACSPTAPTIRTRDWSCRTRTRVAERVVVLPTGSSIGVEEIEGVMSVLRVLAAGGA